MIDLTDINPWIGIAISIVTACILAGYCFILYNFTGKNRSTDKLLQAFAVIAISGLILHLIIFYVISISDYQKINNALSIFWFSIQYTLEMFIANPTILKISDQMDSHAWLFHIYLPIYGMAVLTSGFAIFHFLSRWIYNHKWLKTNVEEGKTGTSHIFIGDNIASRKLAKNIRTSNPGQRIVFIDLPDQPDVPHGISIFDIIARYFKDSKETEDLNEYIVLKAGKGLNGLSYWLANDKNSVYILSDDQSTNIAILEALWERRTEFKCRIFCHAKKDGLINRYAGITDKDGRITFVDSAYLSVEYLKKHNTGELMPVNFVEIAEDSNHGRLGYVTSSFNCAIIGFGETGKEAMKFLYEFGAFPDKNSGKAPFKCHIFDNQIEKSADGLELDIEGLRSSAAKEDEFILHKTETESYAFYTEMLELIQNLNYIVICQGEDSRNLKTALRIAELAEMRGRNGDGRLCIAVKQTEISALNRDTIENANRTFGNCIHTFGMLDDIWKIHIISNELIDKDARRFFESYTELGREIHKTKNWPIESWESRESKIKGDIYSDCCEAKRKIMQDYSNCLHINTKRILCKGSAVNPDMILAVNDNDVHCHGELKEVLERLAVCEHLRWEASHMMLGYKPTDGKTNDLMKLHRCLKPYKELDETTKHFDWLVVKNSL